MDEDLILYDENESLQAEEIIQNPEHSETSSEILQIIPEEINISDPFFMGVQICGVMCLFSLGISMILRMFRRA